MSIQQSIIKIIGYIVFLIIAFLVLMRVDTYLKYKGFDDCAKISQYENASADGTKTSYPVGGVYQQCLKDKGL